MRFQRSMTMIESDRTYWQSPTQTSTLSSRWESKTHCKKSIRACCTCTFTFSFSSVVTGNTCSCRGNDFSENCMLFYFIWCNSESGSASRKVHPNLQITIACQFIIRIFSKLTGSEWISTSVRVYTSTVTIDHLRSTVAIGCTFGDKNFISLMAKISSPFIQFSLLSAMRCTYLNHCPWSMVIASLSGHRFSTMDCHSRQYESIRQHESLSGAILNGTLHCINTYCWAVVSLTVYYANGDQYRLPSSWVAQCSTVTVNIGIVYN